MTALSQPVISAEMIRVYCESPEIAALLSKSSELFDVATLPLKFSSVFSTPAVVIAESAGIFTAALRDAVQNNSLRMIYVLRGSPAAPREVQTTPIFSFVAPPLERLALESMVRAAYEHLMLARSQAQLQQQLQRARGEIDELNEIGIALSTQRDTGTLLEMILQKSREITFSDAGSLYLVEEGETEDEKRLRFKLTQNDSLRVSFSEFTLPINASSIAGYVASTGEMIHLEDVYQIPPSLPFRFNLKFDQESGYRTKSMLVVPMKNPQREILGVLQLINCKRDRNRRITPEAAEDIVIPYPESRRSLVNSLASQAAVALENNRLYESIERLFEGFVKASVVAIEARDPTTSGHSFRVADLTVALAEAVDRNDSGPYRDVTFSRAEMKEIRYASLLHDFGKVGVREEVLVKARKLYPQQMEVVRQRFDFVRKAVEQQHTQRQLQYALEKGRDEFLRRKSEFDADLAERLRELDSYLAFVLKCNEPTVLPEGDFHRLAEIAGVRYQDWEGEEHPLLTPNEATLLAIPKGSLDEKERLQIESHVVHTFNFLSQIPWTREIRNVPGIARAHHEKLNGTGYPYKLREPEIPFQSKMMTISDIYDALSASDRPYKRAVPTDRALEILGMEANQRLIDPALFQIFREAEIYRRTAEWKHPFSS